MPTCHEGVKRNSKVAILLCTYNTESFLREQINSFFSQSHENWELWVSDDGSKDGTLDIIQEYTTRGKNITIVDGPCRGATFNFLSLAQKNNSNAEYFAWSDADDIWLPDKLTRAVQWLDTIPSEQAALYCGRTEVVDRNNNTLHLSPLFARPPTFQNALCQNIGGGNTMVFNRKARDLICSDVLPNVFFHDWWAYMVVTGCGGEVHYDPLPCLRYRQHGQNLTGSNMGLRARFLRGRRLFQGVMREWNKTHIAALRERSEWLTVENKKILDMFAEAVEATSLRKRLEFFRRSGAHRQDSLHNIALHAATVLGKYP